MKSSNIIQTLRSWALSAILVACLAACEAIQPADIYIGGDNIQIVYGDTIIINNNVDVKVAGDSMTFVVENYNYHYAYGDTINIAIGGDSVSFVYIDNTQNNFALTTNFAGDTFAINIHNNIMVEVTQTNTSTWQFDQSIENISNCWPCQQGLTPCDSSTIYVPVSMKILPLCRFNTKTYKDNFQGISIIDVLNRSIDLSPTTGTYTNFWPIDASTGWYGAVKPVLSTNIPNDSSAGDSIAIRLISGADSALIWLQTISTDGSRTLWDEMATSNGNGYSVGKRFLYHVEGTSITTDLTTMPLSLTGEFSIRDNSPNGELRLTVGYGFDPHQGCCKVVGVALEPIHANHLALDFSENKSKPI